METRLRKATSGELGRKSPDLGAKQTNDGKPPSTQNKKKRPPLKVSKEPETTGQVSSTTSDNERITAVASRPSSTYGNVRGVQEQSEQDNDTSFTQGVPQHVPSTHVTNKDLGRRFDDEITLPTPRAAARPQGQHSGSTYQGWQRYACANIRLVGCIWFA